VARPGASLFYNHRNRRKGGRLLSQLAWLDTERNPWTLRQEIVWDREATHNHCSQLFWPIDERAYWMTKGRPSLPFRLLGAPTVRRFHGPQPGTWHSAPFPDQLPTHPGSYRAAENRGPGPLYRELHHTGSSSTDGLSGDWGRRGPSLPGAGSFGIRMDTAGRLSGFSGSRTCWDPVSSSHF
jgi:hypothetical protein